MIADVSDKVTEQDFIKSLYAKIYKIILNLYEKDPNFHISYVREELIRNKLYNDFGGDYEFERFIEEAPFDSNIDYIIDRIRDKSIKNKFLKMCNVITKEVNRDYFNSDELLDRAQKTFFEIFIKNSSSGTVSIEKLFQERINKINTITPESDIESGIKTYFDGYDNLTGGFHKSDLVILAARPSVGKTALALNFAINAAKQNKKVLIFSLEMGQDQLLSRMLSIISKIKLKSITSFKFSNEEIGILNSIVGQIKNYPIEISESNSVTILDIKNLARK